MAKRVSLFIFHRQSLGHLWNWPPLLLFLPFPSLQMQRQSDDVRNRNIALSADGRKLSVQSALTIESKTMALRA